MTRAVVVLVDLALKAVLLALVVLVLLDPAWGNLEGKAPVTRALTYPLWALVLPLVWTLRARRPPFPWVPDLLLTAMCFSDVLGNRLDLYDSVAWFDDWIHFMNTALLSAALLLLMPRPAERRLDMIARAVAFGTTASLTWELWEYGAFVARSSELPTAYQDTLGDLSQGWLGAVTAAVVVQIVLVLRAERPRAGLPSRAPQARPAVLPAAEVPQARGA
jgi:hypothetical protein